MTLTGFSRRKPLIIICVLLLLVLPEVKGSVPDHIYSEAAVLMDAASGQILYNRDMHRPMKPASITKILTALLALELGEFDDTIILSHEAVFSIEEDSSHIALDVGEKITLEQALYALAIESANDAANGIAEHIGGTMEAFAAMMTSRAKDLGAVNSNFTNAHGLDDYDHYTTAYDMALILREAIKHDHFCKIFSAWVYQIPPTNIQPLNRILRNANEILEVGQYHYDGLIASKTGWTDEALNTLATAACRDDITLIAVVMYSEWRDAKWLDTVFLLDYGFEVFSELIVPAEEMHEAEEDSEHAATETTDSTDIQEDTEALPENGGGIPLILRLTATGISLLFIVAGFVVRRRYNYIQQRRREIQERRFRSKGV